MKQLQYKILACFVLSFMHLHGFAVRTNMGKLFSTNGKCCLSWLGIQTYDLTALTTEHVYQSSLRQAGRHKRKRQKPEQHTIIMHTL